MPAFPSVRSSLCSAVPLPTGGHGVTVQGLKGRTGSQSLVRSPENPHLPWRQYIWNWKFSSRAMGGFQVG